MAHISEEIEKILATSGWEHIANLAGTCKMTKMIVGHKIAGEISDGSRQVTLEMDRTGRWLSSLDGWGNIEGDLDLRDYWGPGYCRAQDAIDEILKV